MTEPNPDSSACLHHPSNSVGWNCSNIAAYPTVPVVSMGPPVSRFQASGFSCQLSSDGVSLHRLSIYYSRELRHDPLSVKEPVARYLKPDACSLMPVQK